MTDYTHARRDVPLWCLLDLNWAHRLQQAGYRTVGDVLDATPEALARNVMGVGPKRAKQIHDKIAEYARFREFHDHYADQYNEAFQIVREDPIGEVTPSLWDAVLTIGSLVLICGLLMAAGWWLLS